MTTKTRKQYLVVRCFPCSQDFEFTTPTLLLEVDDRLRADVAKRARSAQVMEDAHGTSFNNLTFFDYRGTWFDLYSLDEEREEVQEFIEVLEREEYVEVVEGNSVLEHILERCAEEKWSYQGGTQIRSELDQMVVSTESFHFKMNLKHTSFEVESLGVLASVVLKGSE